MGIIVYEKTIIDTFVCNILNDKSLQYKAENNITASLV